MLFVESIRKLVKLGIASSFLANEENYLNVLLIANPEAGKSSILLSFDYDKLKGVFVFTDMTKTVLQNFMKKFSNPKKELRYIILPDLTSVFSHSKDTKKGLIGLLNAGLEDGVREISSYYVGSISETKTFKDPVKFGLATSITKQIIGDMRHVKYWRSIGFMSRLLPVSYSYTKEQIQEIREYIASSRKVFDKKEVLRLKQMSVECNKDDVLYFKEYIDKLAEASILYGFRYTRQFRVMLKANALLRGSKKVSERDVKEVEALTRWINFDYNTLE